VSRLLGGDVAIVTGATGQGSGTEIARAFADQGARVVVTGRNAEAGEKLVAELTASGAEAGFLRADLTDRSDCEALVDRTVELYGSVTVLVNSAVATFGGQHVSAIEGAGDGRVADVDDDAWNLILLVNLTAVMWLCRRAIPVMQRAGRGSVVNVGSRAAERGTPDLAAYTASKGALHALTRSIAVDYAKDGIRANTIAPGYIDGKARDGELSNDERTWAESMHLTRLPTTADVAHAAVWLASPLSAAITGHTLLVDGGASISRAAALG
jgi:NAD(P)-dependent dehydrogenase (short-subunit alcohol dehydrogenase family)